MPELAAMDRTTPVAPRRAFTWTDSDEPHAQRRKELLAKHPQIRDLYGPCPRTKYVCTALVLAQLVLAHSVADASWWVLLLVAYGVGGVINHALFLAMHELSHNLAFRSPLANRVFALFVNLPAGIPASATFRHYHLLHHTRQGEDGVDTDLPTELEGRLITGPLPKAIWVVFQGLAYGLRPLLVLPKKPDRWEVLNFVVQMTFNYAVYALWGWKALAYLPISSILCMGLHPVAGHYISEHYVFSGQQETYSYYGPLNLVTFNVGYHNEHHDFPYIPGSRLPRLRELAPEYYDTLEYHTSWTATLWRYITDPSIGAYSRVKRRMRHVPAVVARGDGVAAQ